MPNEADARIIIDRLLREADWSIEDKAQVSIEEAAADGNAHPILGLPTQADLERRANLKQH